MAGTVEPVGSRSALVVATGKYSDPTLRRLRAPAQDAADMADVLADRRIGGFAVQRLVDRPHHRLKREIERFLVDRQAGDLVVVYLSCHGILDRRGRLYLATTDTKRDLPASTSVEADWLRDRLEDCLADQVLILDCCFGGAYAATKGEPEIDLDRRLLGNGRGRVVLTASRAWEYSFEGARLVTGTKSGSVFTAGLVDGLRSGRADRDGDGYVTVDEAFLHASEHVAANGGEQTPQRWADAAEGSIVLARNPGRVAVVPETRRGRADGALPGVIREWRTVPRGYDVQQVNAGIVALTTTMSDPDRWADLTSPFFEIVGRGATGYDRTQVDSYVVAHRPEPTDFTQGLRMLLADEQRLLTTGQDAAERVGKFGLPPPSSPTGSLLAVVLLRDAFRSRRRDWMFFTTREVLLYVGRTWVAVPYHDVGSLVVSARTYEVVSYDDEMADFIEKSELTIQYGGLWHVLPGKDPALVNDDLVARIVDRVHGLRKTFAEQFDRDRPIDQDRPTISR